MRVSDYVLNQNFVENLHEFEGRLFDIVSDLRDLRKVARKLKEACMAFRAYYDADHEPKTGPGNEELQRLFDIAERLNREVLIEEKEVKDEGK